MKYFIVFAIGLFLCFDSTAQKVSLGGLLSIYKKDFNTVEEYMTRNQWEIVKSGKNIPPKSDVVLRTYIFKNRQYNKTRIKIEFYSKNDNSIAIAFNDVSLYNLFLNQLKSLGFKPQEIQNDKNYILQQFEKGDKSIMIHNSLDSNVPYKYQISIADGLASHLSIASVFANELN